MSNMQKELRNVTPEPWDDDYISEPQDDGMYALGAHSYGCSRTIGGLTGPDDCGPLF